jgi:hypothetical protein
MRIFARCLDLQCAKPSAERRTLSAAEAGHKREKKMSAVQTKKKTSDRQERSRQGWGTDLRAAAAARVQGDFDILRLCRGATIVRCRPVAQIRRQYEAASPTAAARERRAGGRPFQR